MDEILQDLKDAIGPGFQGLRCMGSRRMLSINNSFGIWAFEMVRLPRVCGGVNNPDVWEGMGEWVLS